MTPGRAIRFGVLGTGWVAQRFMADLVHVPGAALGAVMSRSAERARTVAQRFGAARAHASVDALLGDVDLDVIYIASEHHEHAVHAVACLDAGKHVLCEKPFTTSLADTERVIARARATGRFCMEAMWTRFLPAVTEARRRIESGDIGEPLLLAADFGIPVVSSGPNRFFDPARGGGALLDRGVYGISLAVWLFGKPVDIVARAVVGAAGVDESCQVILRFADRRIATLGASLSAYTTNELVVSGSTGRLRLHAPLARPERLSIERARIQYAGEKHTDLHPRSARELGRKIAVRAKRFLPEGLGDSTLIQRPVTGYGYGHQAAEVVRCVREKLQESSVMSLDETRTIAATVDEIVRSFRVAG